MVDQIGGKKIIFGEKIAVLFIKLMKIYLLVPGRIRLSSCTEAEITGMCNPVQRQRGCVQCFSDGWLTISSL